LSSRWDSVPVVYTRLPIEAARETGWWDMHASSAESRQCIPFACLLGDTWSNNQPYIQAQWRYFAFG